MVVSATTWPIIFRKSGSKPASLKSFRKELFLTISVLKSSLLGSSLMLCRLKIYYFAALKIIQGVLNDEGMTEKHADLLQFQLRKKCLEIGASLIYASVKEPRTVETLKAYVLKRYDSRIFVELIEFKIIRC